jgi:3-dehydroquinate dehydratase-2
MTKTSEIIIINGPNLDRLGTRQPEIYGNISLDDIHRICTEEAAANGLTCRLVQRTAEDEIVKTIHTAIDDKLAGIIINAGAYTHTSVAIRDALSMADMPIVEVHISNIFQREEFRHHSYISGVATGVVAGFGPVSYRLAINALTAYI